MESRVSGLTRVSSRCPSAPDQLHLPPGMLTPGLVIPPDIAPPKTLINP